ncbi:MAG: RNA polymerase sigma factor [Geminicoccales bacterium]
MRQDVQPATTIGDEALARRARDGDEAAFACLVERYQGPAFNFAYRLLGNYDDAVDAAQQGFVQLYTALPSLDLDRPLRPWLFRTIRNRCIDMIRQRRTASLSAGRFEADDEAEPLQDQLPDPDPLPEDLVERADLQNLLVAAISRLPTRYREVVALRYTTDLTFAEIAAALGVPENTAKIHFHRAKARLREALRDLM